MTVRLVSLVLHLNLVTDDGDTLTPVRIEPIQLTAAQWPTFDLDAVLAEVAGQLDPPQD